MSTLLVTGIGELTTWDDERPVRPDAAVVLDDGVVAWTGDAHNAPDADERLDVAGAAVIPGFVDSHTHLMFAGDRADEFAARMAGESYTAGGIQRTVRATRAATDDELLGNARRLLAELRAQGTTTVEIKSGYGLTVDDEARAMRLARALTPETTFLGAHVVPAEYADDRDAYLELVTGQMLDACAPHARWIDVFCDRGAFTVDESRRVLEAGIGRGLGARLHGAQLEPSAAVELAVSLDAASVDHATFLSDRDVEFLAGSTTVATLLPGAEFSTRQPYPSGRRLLDAGATIALATDCNPGSSYTTSLPFCIALAVREMGLTVPEALRAATLGGAAALRRDDVGHLRPGATGGLVVLDAPSAVHLAYRPGVPLVRRVVGGGVSHPG